MRNGISEFRPRQPLDRQLGATTLNDIRRELESLRITRVVNGTFRKLPGGTEIVVAPQRGGAGLAAHPFKVVIREINDAWHWGVIANSKALLDIAPTQGATYPEGLLSDQLPEDPGWLQISDSEQDHIYLEWDEANVTARIDSVGNGGDFDPSVGAFVAGGWLQTNTEPAIPVFQFARKIIASCTIEDGKPVVTQGIFQHQLLQDICYSGNPASYWFDYTGGNVA